MMLVELAALPAAVLPIEEAREHIGLGRGFSDQGREDPVIEACLSAALQAIEGRTGKAIFERAFEARIVSWGDLARQVLPKAPVARIVEFAIVDAEDAARPVDPERYRLEQDAHRPALVSRALVLPTIPVGGVARIRFDAGFGPIWQDVPADLRRAVLMLAAYFYEHRFETGAAQSELPWGVRALVERYRDLRIGGRR